jgi:CBS domain-containing protein
MEVFDGVSAILRQKGARVWSIGPEATVYEALERMSDEGIGALLVMEGGAVVGLLSERDYARKIILKGRSSKETKVEEIMISPPLTISPGCSVDEAMRIMTEHRVRHLPVVDDAGTVLGIVSIGDLVKWIIRSHQKTIQQLESYISGQS